MAYQSLYRRYRPRRFDEVRGQEHVVGALRNAVHNASEGHAYLFSGPRGTGKTSTARILAKALNCENLQQGEPCCECTPCQDMEAGRSFDLFELDAASNNGVDAIRDLIERSAVGSPGRTKVYILDEVHMLSPGASNALLKTLEEPPDHVRFVLATTDPQKVLPTIKSRTQHYEFQLLSADELERQVRWIIADADLDVSDEAVAWVVHQGRGSSRDTLSALDQVVAAGGVVARAEPVEQLYEALATRDTGLAVVAVAEALSQGHDPRVLGAAFLDSLRDTFLISLDVPVPHLMAADLEHHRELAGRLGTQLLARAMESLGAALVEMRQAADPRVPLEVALVRLTASADVSFDALVERIERLESALAGGAGPTSAPAAATSTAEPAAATPKPVARAEPAHDGPVATGSEDRSAGSGGTGPAAARAALARTKGNGSEAASAASAASTPTPAPAAPTPAPPAPAVPARGAAAPTPPARPSAPPPVPGAAPTTAAPTPTAPTPAAAEPAATGLAVDPSTSADAPVAEPSEASASDAPAAHAATATDDPAPDAAAAAPAAAPAASTGERDDTATEPARDAVSAGVLDVEGVTAAFEAAVLPNLKGVAKALYTAGEVVTVEGDGTVVFALAIGAPVERARQSLPDVQRLLADHVGGPVTIRVIEDADAADARPGPPPKERRGATSGAESVPTPDDTDEADDEDTRIDISQLENADVAATGIDRLTQAFPGAVLISEDEMT